MTYRPTEYQVFKRLLYARKDFDPDLDGIEANRIIRESCIDALDRLDDLDRQYIQAMAITLQERCKGMAHNSALQVLAAIGDLINNNNGD